MPFILHPERAQSGASPPRFDEQRKSGLLSAQIAGKPRARGGDAVRLEELVRFPFIARRIRAARIRCHYLRPKGFEIPLMGGQDRYIRIDQRKHQFYAGLFDNLEQRRDVTRIGERRDLEGQIGDLESRRERVDVRDDDLPLKAERAVGVMKCAQEFHPPPGAGEQHIHVTGFVF